MQPEQQQQQQETVKKRAVLARDFRTDLIALWGDLKDDQELAELLPLQPRGLLAFIKLCGCISRGWIRALQVMDRVAAKACTEEDRANPKPAPVPPNPALAPSVLYGRFRRQFGTLMIEYAGCSWDEMPHGLPALRYLDRCLRTHSAQAERYELALLSVAQPSASQCQVCPSTATTEMQQCTRCQHAYYCSRACQKDDWRHHKQYCVPVEPQQK